MRNCFYLVFAFALFFTNAYSQGTLGPISISHGEEIEQDTEKIVGIAGEVNDKIYTLATKGKNFFIKVFNSSDMKLISTNEIEMDEFKGKEPDFEDIAIIDGKIYVFGSVFDRKQKISNLLGLEITQDGKLADNGKKLFSAEVTKRSEQGAFYFKSSPDESTLFVMHVALFEKKDIIQYEMKLFDRDLNVITTYLEEVPFEDRKGLEFTIADFDVSLNNDVFLVINESYRDKKAKENIEKFEVHAFKKDNGYKQEIINIDVKDKEIINCELMANRNKKLHLVGFYSSVRENGKANKELKGVYSSNIDMMTNEVEFIKFNEFDYDTKVKLIGERRARKGKDVKPLYVTHSLIEKENGGIILLSEYQMIIVGKTQGIGPLGFTPIQHINNEIIVTSLDANGDVAWSNVIAKKQKAAYTVFSVGIFAFAGNSNVTVGAGINVPVAVLGRGPEYLSAMPIYDKEQLTVIFNDNDKNYGVTDIEDIRWLGNYNNAVPSAYIFDTDGNITRLDQEDVVEKQLVLRPRIYYRKSANEYIIYSSRKSEDRLGRMTLD